MAKLSSIDIVSSPDRTILDLRTLGFKDVLIVGRYRYMEAHGELVSHRHRSMLEICYCARGEQTYEVGGVNYRIKGGDVFVTLPGEWHGTGGFPEEKGELYWVIIHLDEVAEDRSFLRFEGEQAGELRRRLLELPRHFAGGSGMRGSLDEVFRIFQEANDPFVMVRLQHLLTDYLLQVIAASRRKAGKKDSGRMEAIDVFLSRNLGEPVMLRELAAVAGLSLSRFKTWFKEETGSTPLDYALRYKIGEAQRRLQQGRLSIARIAVVTGFQNAAYFATVFRKFTGMTPSEYKRGLKGGRCIDA